MYWGKEKELTPEQVKALSPEVEVHLKGFDRHGEVTWLEGKIVQSGKKKIFSYFDITTCQRRTKDIKIYPGKRWVVCDVP